MERLWLWVAGNIPGLSDSHREAIMERGGLGPAAFAEAAESALRRHASLAAAQRDWPPYIESPDWLRLPLSGYPDFSVCQPYLDEVITHPAPDAFRARHNFRATIAAPGFHATSWFDIFLNSVIATYQEVQTRAGHQRLWIGPNAHGFVYETQFWPRDPYFEWFDHWLRGKETPLMGEPPVRYSPSPWVDPDGYVAEDWEWAEEWPPRTAVQRAWYLRGDGSLGDGPGGDSRTILYDPRHPVPSLGGRNMLITNGPSDQRPLRALPNYGLIYTSAPLEEDVVVAGNVTVLLHVQSDCPDTDFVAKLVDRHPDGQALLMMDGVLRVLYRDGTGEPKALSPDRVVEVTLNLGNIHHTFVAGHQIEVDITSSNFPRRIRNTNSGHPVTAHDTVADIRIATNTVHHSETAPSRVVLPVTAT
jgi:putative CocE/NonD family hydrolase